MAHDAIPELRSLRVRSDHGRDGASCPQSLNAADLSQGFVDCQEIVTPDASKLLWLWILLGVLGGIICLPVLRFVALCAKDACYDWRVRHRRYAMEAAEVVAASQVYVETERTDCGAVTRMKLISSVQSVCKDEISENEVTTPLGPFGNGVHFPIPHAPLTRPNRHGQFSPPHVARRGRRVVRGDRYNCLVVPQQSQLGGREPPLPRAHPAPRDDDHRRHRRVVLRRLVATVPRAHAVHDAVDTNYYYYEDASPFKGKLNCTFDMTAPLNVSNLNQSFIINCEEIQDPTNLLWLWIVLGILALFALYACFSDQIDACWSRSGYNRIL